MSSSRKKASQRFRFCVEPSPTAAPSGNVLLNRFSVTVDRDNETVLIEDVLDPTEAGELRMSVSAVRAVVLG
jgi:hypothetical protein